MSNVVKFPSQPSRPLTRLDYEALNRRVDELRADDIPRKPRRSKNGTPEERAAKRGEQATVPDGTVEALASYLGMRSPSFMALPFVGPDYEWRDEPTDKAHIDYARGRKYARDAVAAIVKDKASNRNLELIVKSICDTAFKRRGPAGALCRKLSSAEEGFLHELSRMAVVGMRLAYSIDSDGEL